MPRATCGGLLPPRHVATAAAPDEAEDADLQRASELSLLEQQHGQAGVPGACVALAAPGRQQQARGGAQAPEPGSHRGGRCAVVRLRGGGFSGAGRGSFGAAEPAGACMRQSIMRPVASCGHFMADACHPDGGARHWLDDSLATHVN
jgi:hypothetical protein